MAVKPIPEGYHTVTPALTIQGAADAIEFYKRAFGAEERYRMPGPGGTIAHAELQIGDSVVMLADWIPDFSQTRPPGDLGRTSVSIFLYVEDVDAVFQQAADAGATVTMPLANQFRGDRFGSLQDPFGHHWSLATHGRGRLTRGDRAARARGDGGARLTSGRPARSPRLLLP